MVLANLKLIGTYSNHYEFIRQEKSWEEFRKMFAEDNIKEIANSRESDDDDKILALCEHLNSLGWSDEDIIGKFLERENRRYWVNYVDENIGYFEVYEVL